MCDLQAPGTSSQRFYLLFMTYYLSNLGWSGFYLLYFPEVLNRFLEGNVLGKIDYSTVLIQINGLVMWIKN